MRKFSESSTVPSNGRSAESVIPDPRLDSSSRFRASLDHSVAVFLAELVLRERAVQGSHPTSLTYGHVIGDRSPNRNNFHRYMEPPAEVDYIVERFAELRKAVGDKADIGIDFHGRVSPALAKVLIKKLEQYNPMFIEEPINCQDHDIMAEIARGTHIPIATGERVFTKWGFREVLEKKAASILQPDLCHAGGFTEVRLIAGMAEAYYAAIAPHNPLGPISLAAGLQISASIPNFLIQEQVSLGEGYLKNPLKVANGYLELPTAPGLGVELDENAMSDKIGHDWKNPETYDKFDGSVTDW